MAEAKKTKKAVAKKKEAPKVYSPSLRTMYKDQILKAMQKKFDYGNAMEVPRVTSISLNMGLGDAKTNSKNLESAISEMTLISGQKPIVTKSKKDISNFKIRKGWPVGCKVTLRSNMMFEFLERLISIALPRTRDFRGLSFKSFDGRGNYNFGIKEQIIFTEIEYDKIESIRGLNVTITTSAKTDDEAYQLLKLFGFPLRDKPVKQDVEEAA
ncbi:MAG: 50S ribosomal protein L5 [Candidatus Marinimicrobia bacterium]|jgi:large subunit ribosomal protein L5|nr:50S ribosomal protein L5 [Candidatus Neomarinimicrobiota bacterium]MBT3945788.1 50S ribosomal protein L5 [Candidatus Neomarinimicrobiota bacterium]MBT4155464.1 50S ribosomal protein L5 [Candidatus Neomarinimicrobiota bacterium]MBT4555254.1 50S ribosomal protein L5 [Candidatus Neomarinimicrobiota bacterium]MBT4752665.1 50S ribosomal protein L5 [Candidatus Neomarinimicrobiota bacterium]|tara:strand:- start:25287 stop:25922 length:636 start_codon:yes stop_codon:yes gene_type:complete